MLIKTFYPFCRIEKIQVSTRVCTMGTFPLTLASINKKSWTCCKYPLFQRCSKYLTKQRWCLMQKCSGISRGFLKFMKTILRYVSPASTQCIAASFPICMQYLHPQTLHLCSICTRFLQSYVATPFQNGMRPQKTSMNAA